MAFDGTEGGAITLSAAAALTLEHRTRNPSALLGHFFGREILMQILSQEGCKGIRIYHGQQSKNGARELVIVGADQYEDDMLDLIGDLSAPCPLKCSTPNALNS